MQQRKVQADSRRGKRQPAELRAFALGPARDSDVVVTDLSYDGCQIRSNDKFRLGEVIELRVIKRGVTSGQIRWASEGMAGVRFSPNA